MEISWDEKAKKDLEKLEFSIQKRIIKKIEQLAEEFSFHNIKKIQGKNESRLRIGDYRVIFTILNEIMIILKVGHRKNIYKFN